SFRSASYAIVSPRVRFGLVGRRGLVHPRLLVLAPRALAPRSRTRRRRLVAVCSSRPVIIGRALCGGLGGVDLRRRYIAFIWIVIALDLRTRRIPAILGRAAKCKASREGLEKQVFGVVHRRHADRAAGRRKFALPYLLR